MILYTNYISELKAPSLQCQKDGSLPSPPEVDAYFASVEQKRQELLTFLTDKSKETIKAYLDELVLAKNDIEKRGFISLPVGNIVSVVTSGVEGADTMMVIKNIDSRLYASVESTISFVKALLGEDKQPMMSDEPDVVSEKIADTGWYTIKEVCAKYKLSYNNVKNRQWRERVGFPTHQDGGVYSSVRFSASEVEEWMAKTK